MTEPMSPLSPVAAPPTRPVRSSVGRGLRRRCPACGEGRLFAGYLKIADRCPHCGTAFGQIRADDIPPYVTILIVGHIVVPLILFVYQNFQPPTWLSMTLWPLLTLALTLVLLPLVKGGIVGLMWCLRLRGDEMH